MTEKTVYKIRFAFTIRTDKNLEQGRTITINIVAFDIDSAIECGKNYITSTFINNQNIKYFEYVGCAVLTKEKVYVVNK